MRILPVIDLKGGMVVHAVAGRRHEYRPIRSRLAADAFPATVAQAFVDRFGCDEVYVADLDAIAGAEPAWDTYEQIAQRGLRLILDSGIASSARTIEFSQFARQANVLASIVVASEAVPDQPTLAAAVASQEPSLVIFSLDLRHGTPIVANPNWSSATPREIIAEVMSVGVRRFIVLDLAAVGSSAGPVTLELCRKLRQEFGTIELISGGGVRHSGDVTAFYNAGCNRVLVATALHDGRLGGP